MSNFVNFLKKYAVEALAIGSAMNTLVEGIALSPKQSKKVKDVIDKLEAANKNILKSVDKMSSENVVKISKSDINDAVKAFFNSDDGKALLKETVENNA